MGRMPGRVFLARGPDVEEAGLEGVAVRAPKEGAEKSVRGQSRTQAIRGWPGIRDWPGDGGPFAESATGLATIQKSKNYLSN